LFIYECIKKNSSVSINHEPSLKAMVLAFREENLTMGISFIIDILLDREPEISAICKAA
jgi:hypothetical protein